MMQENCIEGGDYEEKAGNAVGSDHAGHVVYRLWSRW